jgi:hypothetical protein
MSADRLGQRLRQLQARDQYLKELEALAGRPVHVRELTSPQDAAAVQTAAQKFIKMSKRVLEMPFAELRSPDFQRFAAALALQNPSPVWIWTPRTEVMGMLRVDSLQQVNFGFDFSINTEGILSLLTADLEDSLLLDFSISDVGEQRVQVEIQGTNWEAVAY